MKHHYHPNKLISDIHSNAQNEIFATIGEIAEIADDERTAKAREDYQIFADVSNAIKLGDALCFQMRYREALLYYEKARQSRPNDYDILRRCAVRYMSTMQLEKAREILLHCLKVEGGDMWDITYKLACIDYYQGNYEVALQKFIECYAFCDGSDELIIAVIYWEIMCLVHLNRDITAAIDKFNEDMDVGHHYGYGKAVELFKTGVNAPIEGFPTELCKHIYLYGEAMYYKYKGDKENFEKSFSLAKSLDTYFSSFVYLAILSEKQI